MFLEYLFRGSFLINVAAALIPAIFLMRYIYQKDSIEKEPRKLLIHLVLLGIGSAFIAMISEGLLQRVLDALMLDPTGVIYNVLMAFIVVAISEEGAKYVLTHLRTWKDPAFNYKFDAVVYCVFTSLGFAAFENVLYVLQGGLYVALMRAVLSVPGHMSFAVIMGVFYGRAKQCQHYGDLQGMKKNKWLSFLMAVLAHGFYDACLMVGTGLSTLLFVGFVIFMYVYIFRMIKNEAATDEPVVDEPVPLDQMAAGLQQPYGGMTQNRMGGAPVGYGQPNPQGVNSYVPQGQAPYGQQPQAPFGQQGQAPFGQQPQNPYAGQINGSFGQQNQPQAPFGQQPQAPFGQQPQAPFGQQNQTPFGQQPQAPVNPAPVSTQTQKLEQNPFADELNSAPKTAEELYNQQALENNPFAKQNEDPQQ